MLKEFFFKKTLNKLHFEKLPDEWRELAQKKYLTFKKKAKKECPSAKNYLLARIIEGIALHDRSVIDDAAKLTEANIERDVLCRLSGVALCALDYYEEGLQRISEAVQLKRSRANLLAMAEHLKKPEDAYKRLKYAQELLELNEFDLDGLRIAANVLLDYNRMDDALKYARKGLQADPKNMVFHEILSEIYFKKCEYELALREVDSVRLVQKHDSKLWYRTAYCQYLLNNLNAAQWSIEKAEECLEQDAFYEKKRQLINELKSEINGIHKLGVKYYLDDIDNPGVLALLEVESQRECPKNEAFLIWKALLSQKKRDISILTNSLPEIEKNVSDWLLLSVSGKVKYELGINEGLSDLEKAVRIKKERVPLLFCASALAKEGKIGKAKEYYEMILSDNKTDIHSLCGLGQISIEAKSASVFFDCAITISPDDWRIYFEKAKKLMTFGEFEEAIVNLRLTRMKAENVNPAIFSLAMNKCLIKLGRMDEAKLELERAHEESNSFEEDEKILSQYTWK